MVAMLSFGGTKEKLMGKIKVKDTGWAKQTQYMDTDNRRITEFELIDGKNRGDKVYMGFIEIAVKISTPQGSRVQKVPLDFEFPKGKTLDWCRKNFDDVSNASTQQWKKDQDEAHKKAMAKQKQKEIIVPGKNKGILGPSGKEIK